MKDPESRLLQAVTLGRADRVEELLELPDLDPNRLDSEGSTALIRGSEYGYLEIVNLLLKSPKVNVNIANRFGWTALHFACGGKPKDIGIVKALLKCAKIDVNQVDRLGASALNRACTMGNLTAIRLVLALRGGSLLEEDLRRSLGRSEQNEVAKEIIEGFLKDPQRARWRCQRKLGLTKEMAAELFALVVLLCDGYLRVVGVGQESKEEAKEAKEEKHKSRRFFKIMMGLHLDLQMVLCQRAYGSVKIGIPARDSELAFKAVVAMF